MENVLRVLFVDAGTGYYKVQKLPIGEYFGPVDLGLMLAGKYRSLNIGGGLLAGSIFPGSNRLIFTGFSPCWGGFYVSTMGGAALVFDNLGVNMVSIVGRAPSPSILVLNRMHGEEIQVELAPVEAQALWGTGRGGVYAVIDYALERFRDRYKNEPRVLAVGPAALSTDMGAIASAPVHDGKASHVDTWAGRGGLGSRMLQAHGIVGVIYGGTFVVEDFKDRKVADKWFEDKYQKKLAAKDIDATVKYRFDPKFGTGGTLGVNYASVGGKLMAFNYRSIFMTEEQRKEIHKKLVLDHYLKQFNEETIATKSFKHCGEPCPAVCKKMRGEFKKDYEPYQTLGPLSGVFDQRAAEKLNGRADMYGFDGISAGGVVAWMMELLDSGLAKPEEFGVNAKPNFSPDGFRAETDSAYNAEIGLGLLDAMVQRKGIVDMREGARRWGRRLARERGKAFLDPFVYAAFARNGWMVPNQYWTAGVLSPMPVMGKYYMHYGAEFVPPRVLGRIDAARFKGELVMDNLGMCRFHRQWAEEMLPEIVGSMWAKKDEYLQCISQTASRISSRNASVFWESERNIDFVHTYMKRRHEIENDNDKELLSWLERFDSDKHAAAFDYWFEVLKGIHESLHEF